MTTELSHDSVVSIQVKYECEPYKYNIIAYHPYRQKQLKISVGLEKMFKLFILIHDCLSSVGILVQFEKKLKTTYWITKILSLGYKLNRH